MGRQLVWHERYNIGIDFVDKEHKKLFSILNRLFANKDEDEKRQWVYQEGIKYFKEHAMKHFTEEEAYMASISYEGFEMHRRLHDNFRKKTLPALEMELTRTKFSQDAMNHFLGVCAGWLLGHTLTEDRAINGKTVSKWEELLPEEEQVAMRQVIIQYLNEMFQLEAQVVSDCYGGEKFGNGIYYRLVFVAESGEQLEIALVFEEKLIMNTIGAMIDSESEEVSVMLMNAVRYTSQQFVSSVMAHFANADKFELKDENLLAYEAFQRIFERNNPQFSQLFDTGEGYFAYCVFAPHLLRTDNVVSIQAENAMVEVKKYLDGGEKPSGKKKVLVVDDSDTVLEAMRELLGSVYEVGVAKSGMSAIRCITLDRPDSVLMDYEMPVCDGSQVLGMIRSEKDFADIPVFFLTGRTDKESVTKVISLKPAGYLLKTQPLAEVKREIDGYFERKSRQT